MDALVRTAGIARTVSGPATEYSFSWLRDRGVYGQARDLVPYLLAVRQDSVCLDIGANVGLITLTLASIAATGRVYSFEPSPANYPHLCRTIAMNDLPHCQPFNVAVGRQSGRASMHESGVNSYLASEQGNGDVTVDVISIDEWVRDYGIGRVDFMKIDVEGHEIAVLQGARKTIERMRPAALIEFYTNREKGDPRDLLEAILAAFPKVGWIDHHTGIPHEIARDEASKNAFLALNDHNERVDDLLCCFLDKQISPIVQSAVEMIDQGVRYRLVNVDGFKVQ